VDAPGREIDVAPGEREQLADAQARIGQCCQQYAPQKRACAARAASNIVIQETPSTFAGTRSPRRAGRTDIASAKCEGDETRGRDTAPP
jgi:hypothetical protein